MLNSIVILRNGFIGRITKCTKNGMYEVDNFFFVSFADIARIQKQF